MKNIIAKLNWKVRCKNEMFWVALIPLVILLITQVAGIFGFSINLDWLSEELQNVVGTIFSILILLGVVVDPTTKGLGDSKRAMTYDEPRKDD